MLEIVSRQDHGLAPRDRGIEQAIEHFHGVRVEARVRLVEQENARLVHERARDRYALLQPATQGTDGRIAALEYSHVAKRSLGRGTHVGHAVEARREHDILPHCKRAIEHALVRYETHVSAR